MDNILVKRSDQLLRTYFVSDRPVCSVVGPDPVRFSTRSVPRGEKFPCVQIPTQLSRRSMTLRLKMNPKQKSQILGPSFIIHPFSIRY